MARASPDTALREPRALVYAGMLVKAAAGGRGSAYEVPNGLR